MSSTSIKGDLAVPAPASNRREDRSAKTGDDGVAHRDLPLLEILLLTEWRRLFLETFFMLGLITAFQHWLFGTADVLGLPHPYWLPVLLASCQYGVNGGLVASIAASVIYFAQLSPASAVQDYYAYARTVAVQPATWLATALVLGGLRNLHIHQFQELTDQLAAMRRRANDLSGGVERAAIEIYALERRLALETGSAAAFSRALALIDLSNRRAAAQSCGELFRVATGVSTITIYLEDHGSYVPVWAIADDSVRPTGSMQALTGLAVETMMAGDAKRELPPDSTDSEPRVERAVVRVPPSGDAAEQLAVIVCDFDASRDASEFHRRSNEMGRAFATILHACPDVALETRS
ncbi:hypothetical protein JQ628_16920 [Bradyrhizobium lablabi]|uniref:hypothetical protein n=1 Tax=Bradyrhizobium lablabi TaxID=722472 RepID=UPI001BA598B2|nr:hypothetical protein [Bradyrhizobium lablabi]MBR1123211.1 hypothetical protein [Bradyrhizobium lablabi]